MWLTPYGQRQWLAILIAGLVIGAALALLAPWWTVLVVAAGVLALLSFFRDPHRRIPLERGQMVSPCDGVVSSIHEVEAFAPLGEPALCVRVFMSVLDVHVNRSPCHGVVASVSATPGQYLNALNPQSAEVNASVLMVLHSPASRRPVAAVRQVAGVIARTIVCAAQPGQILQRGQRYGMIKFGSTTELYLPLSSQPQPRVRKGQRVYGGATVLAQVASAETPAAAAASPAATTAG